MLPFVRMFEYGNTAPVPMPKEFDEVLQQQYYNTLYLHKPTNTLYGYGLNSNNQLGLTNTNAVNQFTVLSTACEKFWTGVFGTLLIDISGSIYYAGSNIAFPQISGTQTVYWQNVTTYFNALGITSDMIKSVHIGASTRILLNDGRVACCGHNANAECGTGTLGKISTLQFVPQFGNDVQFMTCSVYGTHYIKVNKDSYFVGENSNGTSGTGNPNNSNIGQHTLTNHNVKHISANYNVTWWFMSNGEVYWSGSNDTGQAGIGSASTGNVLVPTKNTIVSGSIDLEKLICPSSLSVQNIGAPIATYPSVVKNGGANDYGQLGIGSTNAYEASWIDMNYDVLGTYDKIQTISKDVRSSMILTKDYKLYACGGLNSDGQRLPDGSYVTTTLKLMQNMPWY